jgi:hypothetical protein
MCDPVTLTVVAIGATLVGAYGQYQAGKQQAEWANYQAKQTEADAQAEVGAARVEAERIRKAGKRALAEANAALAGSGVDVNGAGTPVVINQEIARGSEEDALLTIVGGKDRAARLMAEAAATRAQGQQAKTASLINATGTLLSGSYQAASGWRTMKKVA